MLGAEKTQEEKEREALEELLRNPQVRVNEDGTKTVTLTEAVSYAKKDVKEVTFRSPRGADWRETDKVQGELGKGFALAGSLSDLPIRVFDQMVGDDALLCVAVASTMGKKLRTGEM